MAKEIERKFLVREELLLPLLEDSNIERKFIAQYYLVSSQAAAVRIRRTSGMENAVLTIKSGSNGISADEFEFDVPLAEYLGKLSERVGNEIVKTRYLIQHGKRTWEVDVYAGALAGLIVVELECDDAAEVTDLPEWIGEEVTYDSRYKNAVLALEGKPSSQDPFHLSDIQLSEMTSQIARNEAVMALLHALCDDNDADAPRRGQVPTTGSVRAWQADGLTEGLMFAPGDAVFVNAQTANDFAETQDAEFCDPENDEFDDLVVEVNGELERREIWAKPASEIFRNS